MKPEEDSSSESGNLRSYSNGSGKSVRQKLALSNQSSFLQRPATKMNGSAAKNGQTSDKSNSSYFGHDREEFTRILIQALAELGYEKSALLLSQESGFELESPTVAEFRNAVMHGEWSHAEELLFGGSPDQSALGLNLQDGADMSGMRFWLRQQKYLELLEKRDTGGALMVLRLELTPLYQDTGKLHFLSSLLMCQSAEDLKAKAEWDGAAGNSRYNLLSDLCKCVSPSVILPEHRLAVLLQQVKSHQISSCLFHNTATSPSLYQDHICDRNRFPSHSVIELDKHSGEVWQVKFSNSGTKLASCGEDGTCIIYEVGGFDILQTLTTSDAGICSIAWSPDDCSIVTCANDKYATLWNSNTGVSRRKLPKFGEPVSSCVWAPDGQSFVTGCLNKERNLCQWNLIGQLVYDWGRSHRIQDLAVSNNGHYLIALDNETKIHVYNFVTRELEYQLDLKCKMGSISISQNSQYLLVNKLDGEVRMIDLESRQTAREFKSGEEGGNYVIRSSFGGANECFVVVGSEEGYVYIWHKESGQLIEKIEGHMKGCCSAVSWNPVDPCMFATAGDDSKVRIWANLDYLSTHANNKKSINITNTAEQK
ncbi:WD repeat-containing protein 26 [Golovinomyces cichoracearum]|uniref:WD repeat-containing protein 26 n=1 Tax=Golovinomyces cichoracearum TaxID=62708 RepID=A0A420HGQ0_9PEZI|nr:WD repeat-containing protein 26 [Golovinomyces cichoracearum]